MLIELPVRRCLISFLKIMNPLCSENLGEEKHLPALGSASTTPLVTGPKQPLPTRLPPPFEIKKQPPSFLIILWSVFLATTLFQQMTG